MNLHIVTGGSRGLGQALCEYFRSRGDHVAEISRSGQYVFDLSSERPKEEVIKQIFLDFPMEAYKKITLTNNAGMVTPVRHIANLEEADVKTNIQLNLIAPMALTSAFLKHTVDFQGVRVIANISSGVATHPLAQWAPYSASKAGLENFSNALEQEFEGNAKVRVINFQPGVVDTEMQNTIRNISKSDFEHLDRFIALKETGQLSPPEEVAQRLGRLILDD